MSKSVDTGNLSIGTVIYTSKSPTIEELWISPPPGWMKVNYVAIFVKQRKCAYLVIRDHNGMRVAATPDRDGEGKKCYGTQLSYSSIAWPNSSRLGALLLKENAKGIINTFEGKSTAAKADIGREARLIEEIRNRRKKALMVMDMVSFNFLLLSLAVVVGISSGLSIPAKFDGFVYNQQQQGAAGTIAIEAFFDPICPDSRDAWPPLKRALQHYPSSRVSLIVHPFTLPYHDNSFVACRALHVVNKLNSSATYDMLELFFKHQIFLEGNRHHFERIAEEFEKVCGAQQENFYNEPTRKMSRDSVLNHVVKLVVEAVGNSSLSAVESNFSDRQTDLTTRISFKYGCTRGVYGTPYFFVNGFSLPDAGSAIDYKGWRSILDPLVNSQKQMREETLPFFL
ncbi:hypothetical protein IFM89_001124 [Coptis chinensis]|uniref:DSBA-like thioredoxin domain-containing protein n=1 Tax=Coptis chinensis TaxID=261450 RepID=A0A835MC70_9MAGN|nr:hypothetical protein IFM89_001124 [Coptis chinensis]